MNKEFVMRGRIDTGLTKVLNFSGHKPGYAYRLVEFLLFPATNIPTQSVELSGTVTAGKVVVAPTDPDFNDPGLIGTAILNHENNPTGSNVNYYVVNDTFLITQDLILMVFDSYSQPVNWQLRFIAEKMSGPEEAVANYKQFTISDG